MIKPIMGMTIAALALTATAGIWSSSAQGDATAASENGAIEQTHCGTISSGAVLGWDGETGTTARATVGQSIVGATTDGTVFIRTGIHACLSPRILAPLFADFDRNRQVNWNDLDEMFACVGGPDTIVGAACEIGIADGDSDIDLRDVAELQRVFSE